MKELSIEEKAKAYDEVSNRMKHYVIDEYGCSRIKVADVFPELAESEDEKIRKNIISWLKNIEGQTIPNDDYNSAIAWLEKQGEKDSIDDLSPQQVMDIAVAKCFDEQKPADMVEPKFHEGDWVVHNMSDGRKVIRQIVKMTNKSYVLDGGGFDTFYFNDLENDYHLWTIKDAKDGDVLAARDKSLFIYDGSINENGSVGFYIAFAEDMDIILNSDDGCGWEEKDSCHPATKEQRETLMKAMADAGYKWDAERKELKNIDEEYNGEDYGIDGLYAEKVMANDIEYTRTNAFIEKACEYMRNHIDQQLTIYNDGSWKKRDEFILDFKKYMKGE